MFLKLSFLHHLFDRNQPQPPVEVRRAALSWCSTTFDLFGAALSWCSTTSRAALPRAALLSKKKICFPYIR